MPAKACQWFYNDFTLFSALPVLFFMYTDKDSNLISDLRTKYGEDSFRTFRKWEIIKKMADYRNHRRFTLKCIKASITPVSCKLKNPLSYKSRKSYEIIHKTEKQLLYEWIRNINNILAMLDKQREDQYKKFKDIISNQNQVEHVQDLDRSRLLSTKLIKNLKNYTIKDLDAIIIQAGTSTIVKTLMVIFILWVDNQMCHPVFQQLPLDLWPLPAFLPHPWPPHLPPAEWTPTQHLGSHHPAPTIPTCNTWTSG